MLPAEKVTCQGSAPFPISENYSPVGDPWKKSARRLTHLSPFLLRVQAAAFPPTLPSQHKEKE